MFYNFFVLIVFKAAGVIGTAAATGLGLTLAMNGDLMANDHGIKPAKYPWFHSGLFNTYDHARFIPAQTVQTVYIHFTFTL